MERGKTQILSEILTQISGEDKFREGLCRQRIYDAFDVLAGPEFSKSVIAHDLRDGTLFCTVSSSVVRSELYPRLEKIKTALNSAVQGETVKKIVLK